jgi:chromosome segregation ATPase
MKAYRVKAGGIVHKGPDDRHPRPYTIGDSIYLSDKDAELLKDFLAGEEDKIVLGELVPKAKLEATEKNLISQHETILRKTVEEKNTKLRSKDEEISSLKEILEKNEAELNDLRKELAEIKKELTTTKGLLTREKRKIQEIETKKGE